MDQEWRKRVENRSRLLNSGSPILKSINVHLIPWISWRSAPPLMEENENSEREERERVRRVRGRRKKSVLFQNLKNDSKCPRLCSISTPSYL